MAPDVAVPRDGEALFWRGVLEHFKDRLTAAAKEPVLRDRRARIDPEVLLHPVACVLERPQRVQILEAEHIDKEAGRLFEVRHCAAEMINPTDADQSHLVTLPHRSLGSKSQ